MTVTVVPGSCQAVLPGQDRADTQQCEDDWAEARRKYKYKYKYEYKYKHKHKYKYQYKYKYKYNSSP